MRFYQRQPDPDSLIVWRLIWNSEILCLFTCDKEDWLLSAWRKLGSLVTHWADSEDSDQTGQMLRLIWVFAGHTAILLVLSCHGSFVLSTIPHHFCFLPYKYYMNAEAIFARKFLLMNIHLLYPRHLCQGVYSFAFPFVCSFLFV